MNALHAAARGSLLGCAVCVLSLASSAAPLAAPTVSPLPCPEVRGLSAAPSGAAPEHPAAALVLLLELGPALSRALVTALEPWGLRVVESSASNPGPSMPSSAVAAQRIVRRCGARAVVWLARDADGFALWVYDAENDRSLVRPAPAPPFDASVAAALALSVKTVLRLVRLAPQPAATPALIERASVAPPAESAAPPTGAEVDRAAWQVGAGAGVRFGPFDAGQPDVRYRALARWSPWPRTEGGTRAWVELAFEAGAPHRVHGPRLDGQVWDTAPELGLGWTQALSSSLALGWGVAAALHVSVLSGLALEPDTAVEDTRFNPALRARGELRLALGRPVLALQSGLELWLRRQRYLVQKIPVLESRRASVPVSLVVQLPLD